MKTAIALVLAATVFAAGPALADKHGGPGHKGDRGARYLEKMDTDKDGKISRAEAVKAAEDRFDAGDADKDGFITADEMKAQHEAMKKKWEEKKAMGENAGPDAKDAPKPVDGSAPEAPAAE